MNANDVNLTLAAAANVSLLRFILIGIARRVMEDCLYFFSGRWHGKDIVNYVQQKKAIDCSGKERKADAAIRRVHFTRAPGSLDVFRVRDGKTRESQTNVFVFRRFRSSSARDCVSRRRERREESSPPLARANCREDDLEV